MNLRQVFRCPSAFQLKINPSNFFAFALAVAICLVSRNLVGQEKLKPSERKRVVVVQPVILCDDDGSNPAASRLPKKLVDRVYTKADLEFLYLPTRKWRYSQGKAGKVNLDHIVRRGISNGMICSDKRIVTLLFVSAVDGRQGPLGRGLQNGNICFVCLGPNPKKNDPSMEAFVVAHEVGHCLNLIHTVDDPKVPNNIPNLQGDGSFVDRLAVEGLHDTQCKTVLKSPLVNKRIRFLDRAESSRELVDESWEPYLSLAHDDMIRFTLGTDLKSPIPRNPMIRKDFVRQQFSNYADEFSGDEKKLIEETISQIHRHAGKDWPLLLRFPWNFVKVNDGFCSNFPHTRGLSIVLTGRVLQRMKMDPAYAQTLLIHEKIHVLQRVCPDAFATLYADYGFERTDLQPKKMKEINLAQNPDALTSFWAINVDGKPHLLATVIRRNQMRLSFEETLFQLKRTFDKKDFSGVSSGSNFKLGQKVDKKKVDDFKKRFLIPTGFDHPNEVAAHLSRFLFLNDYLHQVESAKLQESEFNRKFNSKTRKAFKKIFQLSKHY